MQRAPCRQPLDEEADSKAEYEAMCAEQAAQQGGSVSKSESEDDEAHTHSTPDGVRGRGRASSVAEESAEGEQAESAGAAARSVAATHRKRRRLGAEADNEHEESEDRQEVTSRQRDSSLLRVVHSRTRSAPSSPQKRTTTARRDGEVARGGGRSRKGRGAGAQMQSSLFQFFSPSP